jgi:hypothetical protein
MDPLSYILGGFFMTAAFVLGNGVSRQQVDLKLLKTLGKVYGCNAIYREFSPDVLISTDLPISERIQYEGYSQQNMHFTRKPLPGMGAHKIAQQYFGYSSGPAAVGQAAIDGATAVYLVGFDMGPTRTGRFNNIYADTEFYKKSSANPTFTGNWVRQIKQIAKDFPKTSFFRVVGDTTSDLAELKAIPNMQHMTMEDFLNRINNTKEL